MEGHATSIPYREFEVVGGVSYGSSRWFYFSAKWPSAILRASPKGLHFHVRWSWEPDHVLERVHVLHVTRARGLFRRGVEFEHDLPRVPRKLVFWTVEHDQLLSKLRAMGYPVA